MTYQIFRGKHLLLWFSVWDLVEPFNKTALMSIIESIQNKLNQGEYAADAFVELEKAFNTVDHDYIMVSGE